MYITHTRAHVIRTRARTHTHMCTCKYKYMYIHIYIYTYVYAYICIYIHMYIHVHVYIYIYLCICVHSYTNERICTHIMPIKHGNGHFTSIVDFPLIFALNHIFVGDFPL